MATINLRENGILKRFTDNGDGSVSILTDPGSSGTIVVLVENGIPKRFVRNSDGSMTPVAS